MIFYNKLKEYICFSNAYIVTIINLSEVTVIKNKLTKTLLLTLCFCLIFPFSQVHAEESNEQPTLNLDCQSAILMEASTGAILYEQNADAALPPASVTKIMTLLLVMEAIDSGTINMSDTLQASEYAASMGGSQVFIEPGETMTVEDLLKSVVISSANDAAVVFAENIAGSVEGFVDKMNARAKELNMMNTVFENPTGLDDNTVKHVTSARDIAIMSRELLKHKTILNYTNIWMDTIRNGAFGLTNTNRLIRFYKGATGLKTGSTSKAKFCISATAERDGMHLIAVIMASPTRDIRNECAKKLLDYGFANYSIANFEEGSAGNVKVIGGVKNNVTTYYPSLSLLTGKGLNKQIETIINLPESIPAPISAGSKIGEITYMLNGTVIGKVDITAGESINRISYIGIIGRIFKKYLII